MSFVLKFAIFAILCIAPNAANAVILYKSVPDFSKNILHHWCSSCGGITQVYDQFSFENSVTINQITYNAWEEPGYDPLTPLVEFYTDFPFESGLLVYSYKLTLEDIMYSGPSGDAFGGTLVVARIPVINFEPNETYVLSLYSRYLPPESMGFAWGAYGGLDGTAYQGDRPLNERAGFWLGHVSDVPEPSSIPLIAFMGIMLVGAARIRQVGRVA